MSPARGRKDADPKVALERIQLATRLGDAIRLARRRRRWTLLQLGHAAGLSRAAVGYVEQGRAASVDSYLRLAAALGLEATFALQPRHRKDRLPDEDPVHAAIVEMLARHTRPLGHEVRIDEPYQHFQFAGRGDLVAIDHERASMLHIEVRTRLPNLGETAGSFNAKCQWLAAGLAPRVGLPRFRSETHILVLLWSSEVLHTLRLRADTLRALGPAGGSPFAGWWDGAGSLDGHHRGLIVLDPIDRGARIRRWIDLDAALKARPRYQGYADALEALRDAGLA